MIRPEELRVSLGCSLESVEAFCQEFRVWHASTCGARDAFASELLLREALTNAVLHGGDSTRTVLCVLRGGTKRMLIAIRDGGQGFNWRLKNGVVPNVGWAHGRGLVIYRGYAHRVRFAERGDGVTLIRFFAAAPKEKLT